MNSPIQADTATGNTFSSSAQTDAKTSVPGALMLEIKSTTSERVQDALDDLRTIYGDPSPQLAHVLSLLHSATDACREAIEFEERKNSIQADGRMIEVQMAIGELLSFRKVGDGFSMVIGALLFAFVNKAGLPFGKPEMFAVLRTLNSIQSAPFCSIEQAIPITEILENAGLVVDPQPLSDLLTAAQEAGYVES